MEWESVMQVTREMWINRTWTGCEMVFPLWMALSALLVLCWCVAFDVGSIVASPLPTLSCCEWHVLASSAFTVGVMIASSLSSACASPHSQLESVDDALLQLCLATPTALRSSPTWSSATCINSMKGTSTSSELQGLSRRVWFWTTQQLYIFWTTLQLYKNSGFTKPGFVYLFLFSLC